MSPMRLDRASIAERLGEGVAPWILAALLDPYETAALAGMTRRQARGGRGKARNPSKEDNDER